MNGLVVSGRLLLFFFLFGATASGCFYEVRLPTAPAFPTSRTPQTDPMSRKFLKRINDSESLLWQKLAQDLGAKSITGQIWMRLTFSGSVLSNCTFIRSRLEAHPVAYTNIGKMNRRLHKSIRRLLRREPRQFGVCSWLKQRTWPASQGLRSIDVLMKR